MNNDLISRSELKKEIERIKQNVEEWVNHTDCDITRALVKISLFEEFIDLIDNAPTVEYPFYQEAYQTGYEEGKNERPQGDCENCDFRKFTEKFIEGVVELMNENDITSLEQLSEMLGRGKKNENQSE